MLQAFRMFLLILAVTLGIVASSPAGRATDPQDVDPLFGLGGDQDSLSEMFKEVEELLEDTQAKLTNAVKEMESEEITADRLSIKDLPPSYHNRSVTETKVGNDTILTKQEILKKTDNKTGSIVIAQMIVSSLKSGDKESHECIVDEDCRAGNYCQLSNFNYKCLPCKEDETCTRDGECCDGRLCVWGQCKTSTRGTSGTICEVQQDCAPGLCCALQTDLLFPVCTPLPVKGEQCLNPHQLLDLIRWDLDSEAPLTRCPCSSGLICQSQGGSLLSVCEEAALHDKRDNPISEEYGPLFGTVMPQEDIVYEDGNVVPTGLGVEPSPSEDTYNRESDLDPEPHFVDYI